MQMAGCGVGICVLGKRVLQHCDISDARGPSTKDAQQLELYQDAFDWAGRMPSVNEVLYAPKKDQRPGV